MIGGDNNDLTGGRRRPYSRSASWTDRAPVGRRPPAAAGGNRPRPSLPPLQPLSINRCSVQDWPSAGSDDLGVWPLPPTPRGPIADSGRPVMEFQLRREKLAFFDKECSRIAEHVYLGSDTVAKNHELLRQNEITHVLNCVGFVCPEYFKSEFVYKTLWLQDSPSEDITSILYDVFDYFEDVRQQGGRVLVHCCQGVSRSTSLVIAYLMWREGQSFEDAFHYVKNARGVTNPNMGFASQLLQCQKRVHAMPASPSSVLRMYRMAPHSPYDPLHLVPKMINHPRAQALDSRGAFIVHVPSAIYVWIGRDCNPVMTCSARSAANQVVRYEKANGPILSVVEDEEPKDFWVALSDHQLLAGDCGDEKEGNKEVALSGRMEVDEEIRPKKIDEYDLDFGIFHKALAGGVVPPFSVSSAGSETCLPTRENGWGRLTRKLASGIMKGFFASSKCRDVTSSSKDESFVNMEEGNQDFPVDPRAPSSNHLCGSRRSFECFLGKSSERAADDNLEVRVHFVPSVDSSLQTSPPRTSDSFPCFLGTSPKFCSKSPTVSPSSSDYGSSFTFSPSSANWSDLSHMSSQQPSPSGLESAEPFDVNRGAVSPSSEAVLGNDILEGANSGVPSKGSTPSIAERRGSSLPPCMLLPSVSESSHSQNIMVRSQSFSLTDLDDNEMKDVKNSDFENSGKWLVTDADIVIETAESEAKGEGSSQ